MTDPRFVHVAWHGVWLDAWTAQRADAALLRLPAGLRARVRAAQGSWSGAAASAGTHTGMGALDVYLTSGTAAEWRQVVRAFRDEMFAMWERPYAKNVWPHHIHGVLIGHPGLAYQAYLQTGSYKRGRNGLKGDGVDPYSYRPAKITTAPWGTPFTLKVVHMNLPAPGVGRGEDLGNDAARIKAAVKLVRKVNPHVITWNELGPVKRVGTDGAASTPSTFAYNVDHALGSRFGLIKPTRAFNENYVSYRADVLDKVVQYDDSILESSLGGKHLTRVVFRHTKKKKTFAIGVTHLVPDETAAALRAHEVTALDAFVSMAAVSAKHDDCLFAITGDMNQHGDLKALVGKGMKRARKYADKSDGAKPTFTKYSSLTPSTNSRWELDAIYWSKSCYVLTWQVLRDLVGKLYRKPRASDHDAVYSSARI